MTIEVLAAIPELDLLAVSDSNIDDDNITNETTLQFRVSNVTDGATVQILNGTSVIGQGTANGTSIDIATGVLGLQGDGSYTLTAIQIVGGVESDPSEELIVTLDTQAPGDITSTPPTTATNGEPITYDVDSPEEGSSGTSYSLINPPSGASIDPLTGELQWTPTPLQGGVNVFQVQLMDEAGNTTSQDISIDVTVVPQLVQIRFEAQDLAGNVITEIQAGEDFVLVVYADDLRDAGQGVFAAYMDILFDSGLIAPLDGSINDIDFEPSYSNGRSGNFDTPGLIDEVGSFGPTTPTGPDEVRLFALDFVATDQGTVEFTGDGAVGIGHEILVFGTNTPVAPNEVTYLPATLEIIAGLEAIDDLFNFDEDSSDNPLDVLVNDDNQSGGTLSITEVGSTSNGGSVTIDQQNNQLIYTPAADFFGEDVFTYTISNGSGFSTATVTVQVAPVNDPPTANDDAFTVTEDSTDNFLNVQGNDEIAPDADETLRVIAVDETGMQGTLSITPNGTGVEYTPAAGFVGTETFTYTVRDRNDAQGLTSEATVTVTVQSENAPVLDNDTATVDEDSVQNEIDVLDGDEPHTDGNVLEIASVTQSANGGTVTIGSDDLVRYTPPSDFTGTDTFTYTVIERDATTDEETGNATATVTVTVNDVNDAPTAVDDTANVVKDTSETLDVLENDEIFPDTDETLRITEVSTGSEGGTVAISSDGLSIEYTPAAGFEGTETFTYTISDREGEGGLTSQATVTVDVLQYVPRSISGSVNLQYQGLPLSGLWLNLSGTDDFGTDFDLSRATAITGDYAFGGLAPGTYQLSHGQLPFLIDSTPSMMIQSAPADGDSTDNDFQPLGRQAAFLSIADFLASAPGQSMHSPDNAILAALVPGEAQAWFVTEAGWEDTVDGEIRLSEDGSEITVRTTETDGTVQEGTIASENTQLVKVLGRSGDNVLVRIYGGPSDLGMEPVVSGSSSSGGEGEPGSAAVASLAAVSQFVAPSGMTGGEGESVSGLSDVTIGAFAQTQAGTPQAGTLVVGSTAIEATGDAGDAPAATDASAASESPLTAFLASSLSQANDRDAAVTTGGATTPSAVDAILGDQTESPIWAAATSIRMTTTTRRFPRNTRTLSTRFGARTRNSSESARCEPANHRLQSVHVPLGVSQVAANQGETMNRLLLSAVLVGFSALPARADDDTALAAEAEQALRQGCRFFHEQVSTAGGYLWQYSSDLERREGEGRADSQTVWVQPPGTPSVGLALLEAYRETGAPYLLEMACDAGRCLVRGQLQSGGWDYRIEFDPSRRRRYAYQADPDSQGGRNVSTLDDNTTQAALRLLVELDRELDFADEAIHRTATNGLAALCRVQYPNGAWPQRFEGPPESPPAVRQAAYPETWPREFPARTYTSFYTFNDNTMADMIDLMFLAARVYGDADDTKAAAEAASSSSWPRCPNPSRPGPSNTTPRCIRPGPASSSRPRSPAANRRASCGR